MQFVHCRRFISHSFYSPFPFSPYGLSVFCSLHCVLLLIGLAFSPGFFSFFSSGLTVPTERVEEIIKD